MRLPITRLISTCVPLALAAGALAQDWYVAPGGNDGGAGSPTAPFASIGKGVTVARAGDTVWIKPGTYVPGGMISPANSGTASAPISIRNQGGGDVVIDAQNKVPSYNWDGTVNLSGKSWIIIDGLRVVNSHWFAFSVSGGAHVTIQNCSTYNSYASGIYVVSADSVHVLHNAVQRACQYPVRDSNQGTQECISLGNTSNFEVGYNTVFDRMVDVSWGGEGIDCKGSCRNGTVHHNTVYDLIRVGLYNDAYGGNLDNIEIYANTVRNTHHGIIVGNEVNGGLTNNVRVHDNLVTNCPNRGISTAGYDGNGPVKNIQIYNNTVSNCGASGGAEGCGVYIESSNGANANFVIRNNIFANNATQMRTTGQNFLTIDRNLVFGATATAGSNAIQADPRFVNAAGGDFHLAAGSPAIDAALGTPVSGGDHDDRARPVDGDGNGSAVADLGAFERAASTTTTNAPPTVSLSAPASGTVGSAVSLSATAADGDGSVAKVEFFAGATLIATDASAPYTASWTPGTAGTYQITAKATDNLGASTVSAGRSLTVTAPTADGGPVGYTYCAEENGTFTIVGRADLAYGANGRFAYLANQSGTVTFSNAVFGDPIVGTLKKGYYRTVSATTPPSVDVSTWVRTTIGTSRTGSVSITGGTVTLQGSGADIWNSADGFEYLSTAVTGDGEFSAKVVSISNTNQWAKAGVMVRASLAAGSGYAYTCVTPGNGVDFQRRGSTNASAVTDPGATVAAPYWVKVVRSGSTIQGWQSADGSAWTRILSDTVAVNATFLIGLAVTSHADGILASGVFSDLRSSFAPVAAN